MADEIAGEAGSEETETSETQESKGSEETSEGTEETSGGEAESGQGSETQEAWVVPGRYKTVEELKAAQQYFESENSRRANELHRLKQERQQGSRPDPKEEIDRFAEAVKRNPVEAVREVAQKEVEAIRYETRQTAFVAEHNRLLQNKEYAELEPTMTAIANQYEDFLDDNMRTDPKLLHILFYAAKGLKADEKAKKAAATGKAQGERTALKKAKAAVEGTSGTKGHVKRNFEDLSLAEMKKELQKGNV